MTAPLAILDRDGTLIDVVRDEDTGAITTAFHPNQLRILPGAVDGLRVLADAGFTLAIATNQPAPAKGQFSAEAVLRTNDALVTLLAESGLRIAAVEVCMHHPDGGPGGDVALVKRCDCRKPAPGMVNTLVARLGADRASTWMIGDAPSDVDAGRAAAVKTGLVFTANRCELCPLRPGAPGGEVSAGLPDVHGATLLEVARGIVGRG